MGEVVARRRAQCVCFLLFGVCLFWVCVLGRLFSHSVTLCSFSSCLGYLVSLVYLVRFFFFWSFSLLRHTCSSSRLGLVIAMGKGQWELRDASTLAGLGMVVCTGLGYVWVMGMCKSRDFQVR